MIKYSLVCSKGHDFEGWFSSGEEFERLRESGHLNCAACGTSDVSKALMAPSVRKSRRAAQDTAPGATMPAEGGSGVPAAAAANMAVMPDAVREAYLSKMREFRDQIVAASEDVGERFSEEARKIHYGEAEQRGIFGKASSEEAVELLEEGIPVLPLPVLPEDRN